MLLTEAGTLRLSSAAQLEKALVPRLCRCASGEKLTVRRAVQPEKA